MEDKGIERFIKYMENVVQFENTVAPFDLCRDSQTQCVVDLIEKICQKESKILDYGCGNLRLLNALCEKPEILKRITYVATDVSPPNIDKKKKLPYTFKTLKEIKKTTLAFFDVIVVMNVIHEISINEFTELVETARRLLKVSGKLLLIDMAILPVGEYKSLPFYPWEIECLFFNSNNLSYKSKSGIPVVALEIDTISIPIYQQFKYRLIQLVTEKRDFYSMLACSLHSRIDNPKICNWLFKFSLNHGDVHDLTYLMLISGFANFRLIEEKKSSSSSFKEIATAAEAILKWFFKFWENNKYLPNYFTLMNKLGREYTYKVLTTTISYMSDQIGTFFLSLTNENLGLSELTPSESLDVFEDQYSYKDIWKLGLGKLQAECHRKMWPEY